MIEIKKIDITVLLPKCTVSRINIYPEGRVIIYQQHSVYEYDIRIDKFYVPKLNEMFSKYLTTDDNDIKLSSDIMDEYKKTIKLIGDQLIGVCRFNVSISNEIEIQFNATNESVAANASAIQQLVASNASLQSEINRINYMMLAAVIIVGLVAAYQNMGNLSYAEIIPLTYTILLSDLLPRDNIVYDNITFGFLDPF